MVIDLSTCTIILNEIVFDGLNVVAQKCLMMHSIGGNVVKSTLCSQGVSFSVALLCEKCIAAIN